MNRSRIGLQCEKALRSAAPQSVLLVWTGSYMSMCFFSSLPWQCSRRYADIGMICLQSLYFVKFDVAMLHDIL